MAMDFNVYNRYLHDPLINVYGFLNVIMNIGFFISKSNQYSYRN